MTVLSTRSSVSATLARAWRPREKLTTAQWAERYRVVPASGSARPGPWRNDLCPYLVGVMDAMSDPLVREVTFMKSAQVGATEVLINRLLYRADVDPTPVMFVYPNDDDAARASRTRVLPAVDATPRAARLLPEAGRSAYRLSFTTMGASFVSARSRSATKSAPVGELMLDEKDELPDDAVERARQRTSTFPNPKINNVSTPTLEGVGIDADYARSDQRVYWVPCLKQATSERDEQTISGADGGGSPLVAWSSGRLGTSAGCGRYQVLRFGNLRWEGGLKATLPQIRASVAYKCEHCGRMIPEHEKGAMLAAGVWAKKGQVVLPGGVKAGDPDDTTTPGQHAGFWINQLYSPFVSWATIAHEFVESKGDPAADWVNHVLAEPYRPRGQRVEVEALRKHFRSAAEGGYRLGEIPRAVLTLTAAIDLQRDRMYVEVLGWGEHAREVYLVHYQVMPAPVEDPARTRASLESLLSRRWALDKHHPLHDAWGGAMRVGAVAIDSGDGLRAQEVYRLAAERPKQVRAVKGRTSSTMAAPWDESVVDLEGQGSHRGAKVVLLTVNVDRYKGEVVRMLSMPPPGTAGGAELAECPWRFPAYEVDTKTGEVLADHDEYLLQLTAEELVTAKVKAGPHKGRVVQAWRSRPGRRDNHFLDCRVYNLALADRLGLSRLTAGMIQARGEVTRRPDEQTNSGGGGGGRVARRFTSARNLRGR